MARRTRTRSQGVCCTAAEAVTQMKAIRRVNFVVEWLRARCLVAQDEARIRGLKMIVVFADTWCEPILFSLSLTHSHLCPPSTTLTHHRVMADATGTPRAVSWST